MQCVGIHTSREHLSRCRLHGIVCARQTGNGVEQDHHIMSTFNQAAGFIQHNLGNLYVTIGRLIKSGGYNFGLYAALHVGNLFGSFINEEDDHVYLRMVVGNSIGNVFEQHGFTGLGLCHDQAALSFPDGRKHVNYTAGEIVVVSFCEIKFLIWKEWFQMVERYAVTHIIGLAAVDEVYLYQREKLLSLFGRTNGTLHYITGLEAEETYLRL